MLIHPSRKRSLVAGRATLYSKLEACPRDCPPAARAIEPTRKTTALPAGSGVTGETTSCEPSGFQASLTRTSAVSPSTLNDTAFSVAEASIGSLKRSVKLAAGSTEAPDGLSTDTAAGATVLKVQLSDCEIWVPAKERAPLA